jgi:hypothetical protein
MKDTLSVEHIDPRNGVLVSGLCNEFNEVIADLSYNARKTNRFVPYRVLHHKAPVTFGDVGEFLIGGEWVVCEFGGEIWWAESNRVGNACVEGSRKRSKSAHSGKDEFGRSVLGVKNAERLHLEKNEQGKSVNAVKAGKASRAEKNEQGKSVNAVKAGKIRGETMHSEKDELGRSVHSLESLKTVHDRKDERGKSLHGVRSANRMNCQRVKCLVTGYVTNPGALSAYQKARGIDTSLRVKLWN